MLYRFSLTRAVHLKVLQSLEVEEFLSSLKRLIARRGRPEIIYSDKVAQQSSNRREGARVSCRLCNRRFNLSRAPWWGGQFERLIGLFKRAFYKAYWEQYVVMGRVVRSGTRCRSCFEQPTVKLYGGRC